jgi:hypothetical protein
LLSSFVGLRPASIVALNQDGRFVMPKLFERNYIQPVDYDCLTSLPVGTAWTEGRHLQRGNAWLFAPLAFSVLIIPDGDHSTDSDDSSGRYSDLQRESGNSIRR